MKLPNGPKTPAIFQLINWIVRPFQYLDECTAKYGDMFTLRFFRFPPLVMVTNPQGIKEIFNADAKSFDVGRTNDAARPLLGDNSLILMDGSTHKKERKLLMPPFHGEKVKSYAESICKITAEVASRWEVNKPFIARNISQEITIKVIMRTVFGLSSGEKYQQIKPLLVEMLNVSASPIKSTQIFFKFLQVDLGAWSPWGKYLRNRKKIYDLLQAEIEDRRANPEKMGDDILSLMLSARDEEGQAIDDEQLKDEMVTLLIAGHDTTATSLAWAFYWLEKSPEVKAKLLREIDSLGENPDPIEISRSPYLTAVCQETLRLYPIGITAFARVAKEEVEIMGRKFPAETSLVPCIYSTHHREDLYPNSFEFNMVVGSPLLSETQVGDENDR